MSEPYYADGLVTLYHGDCLEIDAWLRADVLVTDPPYGIAWEAGRFSSDRARRDAARQSIAGDEDTALRDTVLRRWRRGQRPAIVFGSWRRPRPRAVTHRLIWHKAGRAPGLGGAIYPVDEEIYLIGSGWVGPPMPNVITTTEWRSSQPRLIGHPTPKPLDLMERLIAKAPAGVVADPFAGSGATLLAGRALGRQVIGVEIEERYCEVIAKRFAQQVIEATA